MPTIKQLEEKNQTDLEQADRIELVDIRTIRIDTTLPPEQRMADYLEQVKNPYRFLCGDTPVRIRFEPEGDELRHKLKEFLLSLKKSE